MYETFGDRLKILRKEHGMTMDEFVEQINKKFPDVILNKSHVLKIKKCTANN